MIFDRVCTVFNFWTDENNVEGYSPTVLDPVKWIPSKGSLINALGIEKKDAVRVQIPVWCESDGKMYLPPKKYAELEQSDLNDYWTLGDASEDYPDFILKGEYRTGMLSMSEVRELRETADEEFTIRKADDKRYPSADLYLQHWKVSGD